MDYVYSPEGANATLHCTVNNTHLTWEIGQMLFSGEDAAVLQSRGIYLLGTTTITPNGPTTSSVLLAGRIVENNATMACCDSRFNRQLQRSCTTIIIYG